MWKALDIAQATEVVKGKEGGLDYMIEQGGKNLSGWSEAASYNCQSCCKGS